MNAQDESSMHMRLKSSQSVKSAPDESSIHTRLKSSLSDKNAPDDSSMHTTLKSSLSVKDDMEPPSPDSETPSPESHDFGESACGEPLIPQHMVIDFTPTADDTDFIQKKCCAFWDFVMTCPELEQYKVVPDLHMSDIKSRTSDIELATIKSDSAKEPEHVKTAVSMLEFVEEKGLITRVFEAKIPSRCSAKSADYFDDKPKVSEVAEKGDEVFKRIKACTCKKVCKSCEARTEQEQQPKMSLDNVHEICKELQDWDLQHPKSLEPPGHPPISDHH